MSGTLYWHGGSRPATLEDAFAMGAANSWRGVRGLVVTDKPMEAMLQYVEALKPSRVRKTAAIVENGGSEVVFRQARHVDRLLGFTFGWVWLAGDEGRDVLKRLAPTPRVEIA